MSPTPHELTVFIAAASLLMASTVVHPDASLSLFGRMTSIIERQRALRRENKSREVEAKIKKYFVVRLGK